MHTPRLNHSLFLMTALMAATLALSACGESTKEKLGLARRAPDAFAVVTRAPLELPPDYTLRPPEPGAPRPQDETPADMAEKSLLGNKPTTAKSSKSSKIENVILKKSGADQIDPDIRATVTVESGIESNDSTPIGTRLLGMGKDDDKNVINPVAEKERLDKQKEHKPGK